MNTTMTTTRASAPSLYPAGYPIPDETGKSLAEIASEDLRTWRDYLDRPRPDPWMIAVLSPDLEYTLDVMRRMLDEIEGRERDRENREAAATYYRVLAERESRGNGDTTATVKPR